MPPQDNNAPISTPGISGAPIGQAPAPVAFTPPPPKKEFPKFVIWMGGAILLLIAGFLVFRFLSGRSVSREASLTWWGLWEDDAMVRSLITKYETENPGTKIVYVKQSPRDYRERLTSSLAKGTGPDIFRFHNTWVPMFKSELDSLPASVMNAADFAKTFYSIASSDLTSGSSIVGIPLEYDALALYINEDIFNKSGKTPPATWDDLRAIAKELTVKDDQGVITQSGVSLGRTENVDHWQEIIALLMIQNGVDLVNPTGKNAEDAVTFFTVFSKVDGVWDATLPASTQAFAGGKLAMYIAPSWRAFEIMQANPELKFKTVPMPQLPKDNPTDPDITYATYWAEGVWVRSGNKSAAWDFLKYLSTRESLQELYQNAAKVRGFGEPYSRVEMASLLGTHPIVGSIITQAPGAKSWYLASRTFDGPTGINSQISNYFEDAINSVLDNKLTVDKALETAASGVLQILSQYKLIAK